MRNDMEPFLVGWVVMSQPIIFPKDEIKDAQLLTLKSEDPEFDGSYIVRMIKASPTIEFVCKDEDEAEQLCKWLKAKRKVVTVDFKKGK